jgi:O-antigen ligase
MPTRIRQLARKLIFGVLLVTPLIVLPVSDYVANSMETPRRIVLFLLAGVLLALLLKAWALRGRLLWRKHPLDLPVVLFFAAVLLTGLLGYYPRVSLFNPLWVSDETMQLVGLCVILYFAIKEFLTERDDVVRAAWIMTLVGGTVAAIGLLDYTFGFGLNTAFAAVANHRLIGTLGNPMYTGTYLAMIIPLGLGTLFAVPPRQRLVTALAVLLMLPALLLTQTRGAWLAFAGTAVFLLFVLTALGMRASRQTRRQLLATALILLTLLGLAFTFSLASPLKGRLQSIMNRQDNSVQERLYYMRGALNLFRDQPILGCGPGNIEYVFPQYRPLISHPSDLMLTKYEHLNTAQPHNLILLIAGEMGIVGLCAALLLGFGIYRAGFRLLGTETGASRTIVIALLGAITANLLANQFAFDSSATLSQNWIAFALLASLGAVEYAPSPRVGVLVKPLSRVAARRISLLGTVVLSGALLLSLLLLCQATLMGFGVIEQNEATRIAATDPAAALTKADQAISKLSLGLALTPLPSFKEYKFLYTAYSTKSFADPSLLENDEFRNTLTGYAERTLQLMDRDGEVQMSYIRYLIQRQDVKKARELTDKLLVDQANCLDVWLLNAYLLYQEGKLSLAVEQAKNAVTLVPNSPVAMVALAHYQYLTYFKGFRPAANLPEEICRLYERAQTLDFTLPLPVRAEYTLALVLAQREQDAIASARELRGTPYYRQFLDSLPRLQNPAAQACAARIQRLLPAQ